MKKIFVALVMLVSLLVPATSASPASAASNCREAARFAIGTLYSRDSAGGRAGTYYLEAKMHYKQCNNFAIFDWFSVIISETSGYCASTDRFEINPNVIGSYNGGKKTITCSNNMVKSVIWNPVNVTVLQSAPSNEKCLGATVKLVHSGQADQSTSISSMCLTFN